MARFQIILRKGREEVTFTLVDEKVTTAENGDQLEQTAASPATAVELLTRLVALRQRNGYVVHAERRDDAVVLPEPRQRTPGAPDRGER